MTQAAPKKKMPKILQTAQTNANRLSRMFFFGTIIFLVTYSSRLVLGTEQSKEYLASGYELILIDGGVLTHIKILTAIASMLLYMLMSAAITYVFNNQVVRIVQVTGSKFWYIATAIVVLALVWPFYSFILSIDGAHSVVIDGLTEQQIAVAEYTRAYFISSVILSGLLAVGFFAVNFYWPNMMKKVLLGLSALSIVLAVAFYLFASFGSLIPFSWVAGFSLFFLGGTFVWTVVYLLWTYRVPSTLKLSALVLFGVLMGIKFWDLERNDFAHHSRTALLTDKTKACNFLAFDRKSLKELGQESIVNDVNDEERFGQVETLECEGGKTYRKMAPSSYEQRDYFEQKLRSRLILEGYIQQRNESQKDLRALAQPSVGQQYARNAKRFFQIPNVNQKIDSWLRTRAAEIQGATEENPYRVYIAAAQGGGIYASYYAAAALARLQDECPHFGDRLFAISAVSGGGIGAQLFSDLYYQKIHTIKGRSRSFLPTNRCRGNGGKGIYQDAVSRFFLTDFQAPLIGALLYHDLPSLLLPRWLSSNNRANALEWAIAGGWDNLRRGDFVDSTRKRYKNRLYFKDKALQSDRAPTTIVNATLANNGMPVVVAPFYFSNFYDALQNGMSLPFRTARDWRLFRFAHFADLMPGIDIPVNTAVVLGARFPYVTPGGKFPVVLRTRQKLYNTDNLVLADGGYFDNTGTSTALVLVELLKKRLKEKGLDKKVTIHLIRMLEPNLPGFTTVRESPNEAVLPVSTLYWSRVFKRDFHDDIIKLSGVDAYNLRFDPEKVQAPLSWQLSRGTRRKIDRVIDEALKNSESDFYRLRALLNQ